ncbi:MATE family efflux transporter [Dethiothermospora halolimnae]|uniref:MATE family efflux transporter n=1 Tax=Dethiothermospora halolimnae TaxID=3114390 RepID=UPI003CCBD0B0
MILKNRLTEGNILKVLTKLALPIMGTSFVQMAYSMMDMIWLGRVGSKAVSASGTAGFFTWLAMAFIILPKIGAEVGVSQSVGKDDYDGAKKYVRHTIQMVVVLGLLYGTTLIIFRDSFIGFFKLSDSVTDMAIDYLVIVSLGIVFYFINPVFTAIFNGYGDSKTPFRINAIALSVNLLLDPILIFGVGPIPSLGVKGAAIATITAQFIGTMVFVFSIRKKRELTKDLHLLKRPEGAYIKRIVKLGFPVGLQNGSFTIFAMLIGRIISGWGDTPIAVQKVGSQIEAISWMTAGGFQTALSAFVGQNYGAKKWDRIYKGYYTGMKIVGVIGIFATCLLIFGARPIFSFFIPDEPETIEQGVIYLRILGLSQFFMCVEIATSGAFNGLGKTVPPSIIGIIFTGLRVPAAYILSRTSLGLNGVWWSISMSSVFKGLILPTMFMIYLKKNPNIVRRRKRIDNRE